MKKILMIMGLVVLLASCSQQSIFDIPLESQRLGTPKDDALWAISSNGPHLYVGGETQGSLAAPIQGPTDGVVRKYDGFTAIWTKQFGDTSSGATSVSSILANVDGSAYVVGKELSKTSPFIAKYDRFGSLLWKKTFAASGVRDLFTIGGELQHDASGNLYVLVIDAPNLNVVKLDPSGNVLQTIFVSKAGGPPGVLNYGGDIKVDPLGNLYVISNPYRRVSGSITSSFDVVFKRLNNQGKVLASRSICTGPTDEYSGDIEVDNLGNIYMTCTVRSADGIYNTGFLLYKLTNSGQFIRVQENISGPIALDSQNNLYVAGISSGVTTGIDINVTKYDPSGNYLWNRSFGGQRKDTPTGITVTDQVYVIGIADDPVIFERDPLVARIRKTDGRLLQIDQ
jgi:hypothetical protein